MNGKHRTITGVAVALVGGALLVAVGARRAADGPRAAAIEAPPRVVVYKSPTCGCCRDWIAHLERHGFRVEARDRDDLEALKDRLGVPAPLRSCHTALVGRYVVEGHVPAELVRRLLAEAPRDVRGLAVPGMPVGSPGMEVPGRAAQRYDVIAFGAGGETRVYARR